MSDARENPKRVRVGPWEYVRRDYTPKRRGQQAGHGWVRQDPRAEVGMEAKILVDEIVRLRVAGANLLDAYDDAVVREALDALAASVEDLRSLLTDT